MDSSFGNLGLWLTVFGAILLGVGDAFFNRSVLVQIDVLEANVLRIAQNLHNGGGQLTLMMSNPRRLRTQDGARSLKSVGWFFLILGFLLQIIALRLATMGRPTA